jgi:hypothetical protein
MLPLSYGDSFTFDTKWDCGERGRWTESATRNEAEYVADHDFQKNSSPNGISRIIIQKCLFQSAHPYTAVLKKLMVQMNFLPY